MKNNWERLEEELVFDGRIFELKTVSYFRKKKNQKEKYHFINSTDWINIIPITPQNEIVMINQFRIGIDNVTLETPGGLVDSHEKDPIITARRELMEETGYEVDEVEFIGKAFPNPAIQNNTIHFYLGKNAKKTGEQNLDPGEDIEVTLRSMNEIPDLIQNGTIMHAMAITAFGFLFLKYPDYLK